MDTEKDIKSYMDEGVAARVSVDVEKIAKASYEITKALGSGKKLITFGNGGSAADAQHIAAELLGKFYKDRKAMPAMALTTNTSVLTAIANDYSYDDIFSRQIEGVGNRGDVAIAISTSGNSKNVIKAVQLAKQLGIYTIGLTGEKGGTLKDICDLTISVNSNNTPIIQEVHIAIGHVICMLVEKKLFP